jgi:hypothetical protein
VEDSDRDLVGLLSFRQILLISSPGWFVSGAIAAQCIFRSTESDPKNAEISLQSKIRLSGKFILSGDRTRLYKQRIKK